MAIHRVVRKKIGASDQNNYVGTSGEIFLNDGIPDLRLSDGITPGGISLSSGISTSNINTGYANTAGISTVSQGLIGTPNISVGVVTATSYYGDGSNLSGVITSLDGVANSSDLVGLASEGYVDAAVVGFTTSGDLVGYATTELLDSVVSSAVSSIPVFDQDLNTTDNVIFNRIGITTGEINVEPGNDLLINLEGMGQPYTYTFGSSGIANFPSNIEIGSGGYSFFEDDGTNSSIQANPLYDFKIHVGGYNTRVTGFGTDGSVSVPINVVADYYDLRDIGSVGAAGSSLGLSANYDLVIQTDSANSGEFGPMWTFGADGNLTLPSGFVTSNAVTGVILRSGYDVNIISNHMDADREWIFGADGSLTFPNNVSIKSSIYNSSASEFTAAPGAWVGLANSTGGYSLTVDDTQVAVLSGGNYIWRFRPDGALRFPDGTDQTTAFVGISTGISISGISSLTVTQEGGIVGGAGAQTITANPLYSPDIVNIQVGYEVTGPNLIGTTLVTNIIDTGFGYWEITTDTTEENPFTYNDVYTFTGNVEKQWVFGTDGSLTFPNGSSFIGTSITTPIPNNQFQDGDPFTIRIYRGIDEDYVSFNFENDRLVFPDGNGRIISGSGEWTLDSANNLLGFPSNDYISYDDNNGSGFDLYTYEKPIRITTAQTNVWAFSTDGSIRFPDNTVQTTAYTGYALTAGISTVSEGLTGTPSISVDILEATDALFTGNISVIGDFNKVDSNGIITARSGLTIGIPEIQGGTKTTLSADGSASFSGIVTSFISTPTQLKTKSVAEKTTLIDGNTVGLAFTAGGGNVAICTNPTGDITLNVTDIPTDSSFDNHSISFSVIVTQAGTARTCTAVNLNGVSRTIRWVGGSLSNALSGISTNNGYDIFTFTGINTVGSASTTANYVVLGSVNGGFN